MHAQQDMLRSWSEPFREAHGQRPDVCWYELSLVESMVSLNLGCCAGLMPGSACLVNSLSVTHTLTT